MSSGVLVTAVKAIPRAGAIETRLVEVAP